MKTKNICKFIPAKEPERLEINCFILESNIATMAQGERLSCNRAILVKQGKVDFCFDGEKCLPVQAIFCLVLMAKAFAQRGARAVNICTSNFQAVARILFFAALA